MFGERGGGEGEVGRGERKEGRGMEAFQVTPNLRFMSVQQDLPGLAQGESMRGLHRTAVYQNSTCLKCTSQTLFTHIWLF